MTNPHNRIVVLLDMDCFYVQVEQIEQPEYLGRPCGVAQYNKFKGGSLIAVNYEARDFGIKRGMRGDLCKEMCPNFHTFFVKENRGKADLTKYRDASEKIFDILSQKCNLVEKASIDEAYLDITAEVVKRRDELISQNVNAFDSTQFKGTFVVGSFSSLNSKDREENLNSWLNPIRISSESHDVNLSIGGIIVEEMRQEIYTKLGFKCSAGIASNKTLAKFCCGLNKPNKQTILPLKSIDDLMNNTPVKKIKNLGGKLGAMLTENLKIETMGQLAKLEATYLIETFGEKTGLWLHQISHGIDLELVSSRQIAKSVGCSKNFRGKMELNTIKKVEYWLGQMADELEERLTKDKKNNNRTATQLVIHVSNSYGHFSKSTNLPSYCAKRMSEIALNTIRGFNKSSESDTWSPSLLVLGLSATKFVNNDDAVEKTRINKYFGNALVQREKSNESLFIANEEQNIGNEIENEVCVEPKEVSNETTKKNNEIQPKKSDLLTLLTKRPSASSTIMRSDDVKPVVVDEQDYIECEKCKKKILIWEMPEHTDYHFALEISSQMNKTNAANNQTTSLKRPNSETNIVKNSGATISKKQRNNNPAQDKSIKSIRNYFNKK